MSTEADPIRIDFFKPLKSADYWLNILLWIGAFLSIFSAVIEDTSEVRYSYIATITFTVVIVAIFVVTLAIKFYLSPRAADARRKDILANSFDVNFDHIRTEGYYNNNEQEPYRRLGLSVLENIFFTKSILSTMALKVRIHTSILLIGWLALVLFRETPVLIVTVTAQTVFSALVLERWWRVEWLRTKCENLYESFFQLFSSNLEPNIFSAYVIKMFGEYECGKSTCDVLLDENIFLKDNIRLSREWEKVKLRLYSV